MAAGRCIDCQQAFCPSHQGLDANGPYTNLCSSCLIDRVTQARDQAAADAERAVREAGEAAARKKRDQEAIKARIVDTARRLVQHGSPGLTPRTKVVGQKQTIRGWSKYRDDVRPLPQAWLVGEFDWLIYTPEWHDASATLAPRKWRTYVTSGGVIEPEAPPLSSGPWAILEPKHPATLDAWRGIEAAFSELARRLLRG